jgi:hypothetical protein
MENYNIVGILKFGKVQVLWLGMWLEWERQEMHTEI